MPTFIVKPRVIHARVEVSSGVVMETYDTPPKQVGASERVDKLTVFDVVLPPSTVYDTHDNQADANACAAQQTQITSQWDREATTDARVRGEIV